MIGLANDIKQACNFSWSLELENETWRIHRKMEVNTKSSICNCFNKYEKEYITGKSKFVLTYGYVDICNEYWLFNICVMI